MEKLLKVYPNAITTDNTIQIDLFDDNDIYVLFDLTDLSQSCAWNKKGENLTDPLITLINLFNISDTDANINQTNHIQDKILNILNIFEKKFCKAHGFSNVETDCLDNLEKYDYSNDIFWNIMKSKFNPDVNRNIKIISYGIQFYPILDQYILPDYESINHTYDVRPLRTPKDKRPVNFNSLIKLRGTDLRIQKEIRETELFELIMSNIIHDIEKKDLKSIALFCNKGHHRSVACAEMLKYLYPNAIITHLCISMQ